MCIRDSQGALDEVGADEDCPPPPPPPLPPPPPSPRPLPPPLLPITRCGVGGNPTAVTLGSRGWAKGTLRPLQGGQKQAESACWE
eukprot:14879843-Alexandrium_andersonii.AAC.1